MPKVIVERPRPRSGHSIRKGDPLRKIGKEELPAAESMKIRHVDRRSFNENLKPLRRWLERQINRPWDRVYSEACEIIKPMSTIKNHVKIHLLEFVQRDVVLFDGMPHAIRRWLGDGYEELWDGDLYVHPLTGLLRSHRRQRRAQVPSLETARVIQETPMTETEIRRLKLVLTKDERAIRRTLFRKLKGLWHEMEEYEVYQGRADGKPARPLRAVPYILEKHIRIRSRQLNRQELRTLGFRNSSTES